MFQIYCDFFLYFDLGIAIFRNIMLVLGDHYNVNKLLIVGFYIFGN